MRRFQRIAMLLSFLALMCSPAESGMLPVSTAAVSPPAVLTAPASAEVQGTPSFSAPLPSATVSIGGMPPSDEPPPAEITVRKIAGTVTDSATGTALPGVTVMAVAESTANENPLPVIATTDTSGSYSFVSLTSGRYRLSFSKQDYVREWFDNQWNSSNGTIVTIAESGPTTGIDVSLAKGGKIAGRVTDSATGAGLGGIYVSVQLVDTDSGYWSGSYTDSTGAYTVSALPSGSYRILFDGGEYVQVWYPGTTSYSDAGEVTVAAPGTTGSINVILVKGGKISGTVTDKTTGAGIENAYARAVNKDTGDYFYGGYSDSAGNFTVTSLPTGTYQVYIQLSTGDYILQWYDGVATREEAASVAVTAPGTTGGIHFRLAKAGKITGTVTDAATGTPVQGAYVSAGGESVTYTDENGRYTLGGLDTGTYRLQAYVQGYLSRWYVAAGSTTADATDITLTAPQVVAGIDIAMPKGATISGTVTDKVTGLGLGDIAVLVEGVSGNTDYGFGWTDADGSYSVTDLSGGRYTVRFGYYQTSYLQQWYDGAADQDSATVVDVTAPAVVAGIDAAMVRGGSLAGKVTTAVTGSGIAGISVTATRELPFREYFSRSATTSGNGEYSIEGLPAGSYRLRISNSNDGYLSLTYPSGNRCDGLLIVSPPGITEVADIALARGATVSGRVTDSESGAGIGEVTVQLERVFTEPTTDTGEWPYYYPYATTDASGAYSVGGLAAGEYQVRFGKEGYASSYYAVGDDGRPGVITVTVPEVSAGIDASLSIGGSISGRVFDRRTGEGVGDMYVMAQSTSGFIQETVISDDSGEYIVGGLPTGRYHVSFYSYAGNYMRQVYTGASGTEPVLVEVTAPAVTSGIDAHLDQAGGISGRIIDASTGEGVSTQVVAVGSTDGQYITSDYSAENGDYFLGGLSNGQYRILYAASRFNRETGALSFNNSEYLGNWYGNAPTFDGAVPVTVTAPENVSGIDAALRRGGVISGKVLVEPVCSSTSYTSTNMVLAFGMKGETPVGITWVEPDGSYAFRGVPSGQYKLQFDFLGAGMGRQWYRERADMASADPITVIAPEVFVTGDVPAPPQGGGLAGQVTDEGGIPLSLITVKAYSFDTGGYVGETRTYADGTFTLAGMTSGNYKVLFDGDSRFAGQWYRSPGSSAVAPVYVTAGGTAKGVDAQLATAPDGDMDGDGAVGIIDAISLLRQVVGAVAISATDLAHGDVAPVSTAGISIPDGVIALEDVYLVLKKAVGLPW